MREIRMPGGPTGEPQADKAQGVQRASGGQPPHVTEVGKPDSRVTSRGADLPRSLPTKEIVAQVERATLLTKFDGKGTLHTEREQVSLDAVVGKGQTPSRVAAVAYPDIYNGKPVTVIDLDGNASGELLTLVTGSVEDALKVVPLGEVMAYLDPADHGVAVAAYGDYRDPDDAKYAGRIAEDVAVTLAALRSKTSSQPGSVTTREIYGALRLARGTTAVLPDLETEEIKAFQAGGIIATADVTARTHALDALENGIKEFLRRTEGQVSDYDHTKGITPHAYLFTAGRPTGDVDRDDAARRVLAKAASGLAKGDDHVVVTDAQRLGKKFAGMFPGKGIVDLFFDPASPQFSEVVESIGLRGDLYIARISDGHLSDELAAKTGTTEVTETTNVNISGGFSAGTHEDDSYGKTSGSGGNRNSNGSMGDNTGANFSVSYQKARVQLPVRTGEDLRNLRPWEGILRHATPNGTVTSNVSVERGQLVYISQRQELLTDGERELLDIARELAIQAADQRAALTRRQRFRELKDSVSSPSQYLDDIRPYNADTALQYEMSKYNIRGMTVGQFLTGTANGAVLWGEHIGEMWRQSKEGKNWIAREGRRQKIPKGQELVYLSMKVRFLRHVAESIAIGEPPAFPRTFYHEYQSERLPNFDFSSLYRPNDWPKTTRAEIQAMKGIYADYVATMRANGDNAVTPQEFLQHNGMFDIFDPQDWQEYLTSGVAQQSGVQTQSFGGDVLVQGQGPTVSAEVREQRVNLILEEMRRLASYTDFEARMRYAELQLQLDILRQ